MTQLIRLCPQCLSERPASELYCENRLAEAPCHWSLLEVELLAPGGGAPPSTSGAEAPAASSPRCRKGHQVEVGDQLCLTCGEGLEDAPPVEAPAAPVLPSIDGWRVLEPASAPPGPWERFGVEEAVGGRRAVLTLYAMGSEPDPAVHEVLRRMPQDHVPQLLATGRYEGRAYEVFERIEGGTLAEVGYLGEGGGLEVLRRVVDELSRALASFAEVGLRHRDLRPATVLVRSRAPLDLVVTDFGSARLSDFDLESVAPLGLTRYSAPETIVGAVSAASDWWSLGMLVLEQATSGACFAGVDDRAFHLHVVTRGVDLPVELEPSLRLLLRGLLARDPLQRWCWPQVQAWLAGEAVEAPGEHEAPGGAGSGPTLAIGERSFTRPELFALAAAEARNWQVTRELTLRGAVSTWLETRGADPKVIAQVRRLSSDESLSEDARHALVLMVLNPALPFTAAGDIVTPAWLLSHPEEGYALITGGVTRHLEQMGREPWLVRLRLRAESVRERARMLQVALDEERLQVALLASSRANLEVERAALRRLFPDTEHSGLASLLEKARLSDEDLIVQLCAAFHQFTPMAQLLERAEELARSTGIALERSQAEAWLIRPRREVFSEVDVRTASFARCGVTRVDEWADAFRVERRMPLERAVVLLAVQASAWQEPPKQQYVANLLELFEKRVAGAVQRGPLVRFLFGKTTPRVDLTELGTSHRPADALLEHVLSRSDVPVPLDPAAFTVPLLEGRVRRLVSHALMFRRDTGIDGRYLAFPFVLLRDGRMSAATPRIAPVLLWPVVLELESGGHQGSLAFDREREEVRLNPALEGLLGPVEFARWKDARDELLARPTVRAGDVMDVFGPLAAPRGRVLSRLPGKELKMSGGTRALACSAALFNAEFTGQALSEDLRQMRRMPPNGTGLEAALRVSAEPPPDGPVAKVREQDRYFVVESDPSQEAAVLRARTAPGLLIEGPPGTGKSQTIVNIVADAIGRGESVLVVCQKQAALRVVEKRLAAEGLAQRLFVVVDANRDREPIIRALREQLEEVFRSTPSQAATSRRKRMELAGRIEAVESVLDRHHEALHLPDEATGLSYRTLLGELVELEAGGVPVDVPSMRLRLAPLDRARVSEIEEVCGPLAPLWLMARYEGSPLSVLGPLTADGAMGEALHRELSPFLDAEVARRNVLRRSSAFDVEDPAPYQSWLEAHGRLWGAMSAEARWRLANWFDLFVPGRDGSIPGARVLDALSETAERLSRLDDRAHDSTFFDPLVALAPVELRQWLDDATRATAAASFWGRLSPARWQSRRRVRTFLVGLGDDPTDARMEDLRQALELEVRLRPLRRAYADAREQLKLEVPAAASSLRTLRRDVDEFLGMLTPVQSAVAAARTCPRPIEAEEVARSGHAEAFGRFREQMETAFARHAARTQSRAALAPLSHWFEPSWMAERERDIARGTSALEQLGAIMGALGTLASFLRFRARAGGLGPESLAVFAALRTVSEPLEALAPERLSVEVRRIVRREALLGWKARFEQARPELLLERQELVQKIGSLAEGDQQLHALNQQLLATDFNKSKLGTQQTWDNLTRLRGPRMKRLREVLDQGADIGLMHLRPVWLMNPDVASRLLPLKAKLFDVVIYDEASQMPVEHAVPTMFRAGRVVISGDEKQMPPTSFFASRIDGDDEEEFDGEDLEEGSSETERSAYEDAWNRREVKDCPDLLQLGRGVLPSTTLQIHYRSRYRELIEYSNAAFYSHRLSVPARHPEAEVRRVRPIQVERVNGVYESQTNPEEAQRVVEWLAKTWAVATGVCPSIGVVTFNRKQADLIEEVLEQRAEEDAAFRQVYLRERDRVQDGEEMGFFVKNVENVQGDERDIIVFSTTFGRDRNKAFRKSFGVLGQTGGERRLNVAVTRAREKVVLVTSIPEREVSDMLTTGRMPEKPRDFLQAYLDYAHRVSAGELTSARGAMARLSEASGRKAQEVDSDGFTVAVADFVRSLGHEPVTDESRDAFGVSFAIVDPRTGLFGMAIECDAPRHALLERARAREIWRPKVLARAIPRVHRVSSHAWYHRPDEERRRLREAIEASLA